MKRIRLLLIGIVISLMIMQTVNAQVNVNGVKIIATPYDPMASHIVDNASIYGWFDWNEDHEIAANELETFLDRENTIGYNSTNYYPTSSVIECFAYAPGYYPSSKQWELPSKDDYDYTSASRIFFVDQPMFKKATEISIETRLLSPIENYSYNTIQMRIGIESERTALGSFNDFTDLSTGQIYSRPALCISIPTNYIDMNDLISLHDFDYKIIQHIPEYSNLAYVRYFYTFQRIINTLNLISQIPALIQFPISVKSPFEMYVSVTDMLMVDENRTTTISRLDLHESPYLTFDGANTTINDTAVCLDLVSDFPRMYYPGGNDYGFNENHLPNPDGPNREAPYSPYPSYPAYTNYFLFPDDPFLDGCAILITIEFLVGAFIISRYRMRDQ